VNRENAYRIQEYEQEVKKVQILNNNLQSENNNLSNIIEKVNQDKKYITKLKEESEEVEEKKSRELIQKYQGSLSKILQSITKIKNKYQQEILILKNEVENMNIGFESMT
jgi:seryl-tRNA synthetase